ncbi:DUF2812 domain-containing protein [Agathobaculum sp. Marseille-P7918]|uniref:DUF2812 domain-containing protein n=1 Tax=Agathobaculum sp. Marseille-P7918 TaxID=2479843 RepID=UPI003566467C
MRKTKRRMETLSFYDRTGVERHLEKMAAKGWMLDRVTGLGWVYRRIEPKKLHFSVTYYPKASDFDPGPTEGQQVYHAFSAHAGWQYVCSWAQMQIFCTDQPDAVPIETDPEIELENIHAAMVKGFLLPYGILLAIGLLWSAMLVHDIGDDPIGLFSSVTNLFMAVVWPLLALLCIVEIIAYLCWRARARKAAVRGEFVDTPTTRPFQRVIFAVCMAAFAVQILYNVTTGSPLLRVVSIVMVLYMLVLTLAVQGVKQLLKRRKVSRGVNRAVTLAVDVVLAFAMMAVIVFGTIRATQNGWLDRNPPADEPPLTLTDLCGDELPEAAYQSDWTGDVSPLVAVYDGREWAHPTGHRCGNPVARLHDYRSQAACAVRPMPRAAPCRADR